VRYSIRTRLLIWMLALLVPVSAAAGWLLIQVFGNRLLHEIDVTLQEEAETVAELLATPATSDAITQLLDRIAGEAEHGPHKYITITRAGQVMAEVPRGAQDVVRSGDPQLRIVRYHSPDQSLTVSIAVSAAAALHAKQRLTSMLAIGIPLMLAFCGLGLLLLTGRALRPLEEASRQLNAIAADNLSVRVPVENPHDEVGRMVTVLNRMLDRLQGAVGELQRFTGDAAHELRTPLTVLRTGLDVAQSRERSAADYRAALGEALATTERMCRLADDLLTLARIETAGEPHAPTAVDLSEMLHELAAAWRVEAEEAAGCREVAVQVMAEPAAWVHGNAGDLYRLFNNLIQNALRHGVRGSSARAEVVLSTRRVADRVETTVADGGPGIAPEDLNRVFDRFYRGNGVSAAQPGTGLGLSIAQEIARAHGGQITAANRDSGGCVFTVTFPAR
jgi:signal transduction histidine kinase